MSKLKSVQSYPSLWYLNQLRVAGYLRTKTMLGIWQNVAVSQVLSEPVWYQRFKYLTWHWCEADWAIVNRVFLVSLLFLNIDTTLPSFPLCGTAPISNTMLNNRASDTQMTWQVSHRMRGWMPSGPALLGLSRASLGYGSEHPLFIH